MGIISAAQSDAYKLAYSVLGNAGSVSGSGTYTLSFTLGECFVQPSSVSGNRLESGFWHPAETGNAAIDVVAPTAPVLVSPLNNSWTTNQMVNFSWNDSVDAGGIAKYQFRVSASLDFTSPAAFYDAVSTYTNYSLDYGNYYWQVRAFDNSGNPGSWSDPWQVLVSSRAWRLYMESGPGQLVADGVQGINIFARFVEPLGSTSPLSGYNRSVVFNVYSGQALRKSSAVVSLEGAATYYYRDNVAGEMTVSASYESVSVSLSIDNLVPYGSDTEVWCAEDGGLTKVICPAGTFTGNARIDIQHLGSVTLPSGSSVNYLPNSGREITASIGGQALTGADFRKNVTLVMPYSQQGALIEGENVSEDSLNIYYLSNGIPAVISGTVNRVSDNVSASLNHLSTFFLGWTVVTNPKLYLNFPNPFTPGQQSTSIMYDLVSQSRVSLKVYDASGDLVRVLKDNTDEAAGHYEASWDGKNESGRTVAQGVYVCVLKTADFKSSIKIGVLK